MFAAPDFHRSHHVGPIYSHSLLEDILEDQEFLKLVEVNSIFLKTFFLRKMTYTGSRKALFQSWYQGGFKMSLSQVRDDHVSKWRAPRWCCYLNTMKLSGYRRTTSSCHCVHKSLWDFQKETLRSISSKLVVCTQHLRLIQTDIINIIKIAHPHKHETLKLNLNNNNIEVYTSSKMAIYLVVMSRM